MADVSVTAASVVGTANPGPLKPAGTTAITAGMILFFDNVSGKWWPATAAASPGSGSNNIAQGAAGGSPNGLNTVLAVALANCAAGQPVPVALPGSLINMGATLVAGAAYYLSTTSSTAGGNFALAVADGTAPLATGDFSNFIGFATTTALLQFTSIPSSVAHG